MLIQVNSRCHAGQAKLKILAMVEQELDGLVRLMQACGGHSDQRIVPAPRLSEIPIRLHRAQRSAHGLRIYTLAWQQAERAKEGWMIAIPALRGGFSARAH